MGGITDLPLHWGKVPEWLLPIMERITRAIVDVMYIEWGPEKLVERLSNPLWFQGLNNSIGMDWDSSGSTTVLIYMLKKVLNPTVHGCAVIGGKGKDSLHVKDELKHVADELNFDPDLMSKYSKLSAKVDSVMLHDGFDLYIHSMIVANDRVWTVIQQGMNSETRMARRYHLYGVRDFENSPHSAVQGVPSPSVAHIIGHQLDRTRKVILDLINGSPGDVVRTYTSVVNRGKGLEIWLNGASFQGKLGNKVYFKPVDLGRLRSQLERVKELSPGTMEEAILGGLGPSTTRALILIADLVYNEPPSEKDVLTHPYDPFKYAYVIGGKDGIPYPINKDHAEEVIRTLEDFIEKSRLSKKDKSLSSNRIRDLSLGVEKRTGGRSGS